MIALSTIVSTKQMFGELLKRKTNNSPNVCSLFNLKSEFSELGEFYTAGPSKH
jgi:hypothetical protein